MKRPLVLCILDGWGVGAPNDDNAIINADPQFYNSILAKYPHSILSTSGGSVGLPEGQMGNSEVGHMTIGSGRVIEQDLVKINNLLETDEFFDKTKFSELFANFDSTKNHCHLIGLISDGGVHSHINHLLALAKYLNEKKIGTFIHVITDGRDTLPKSGINFINQLQNFIERMPYVTIATISGRYYAMDRDTRYNRTELAYNAIFLGDNKTFSDPIEVLESSYAQDINDEFIVPQSLESYTGANNGDIAIFTNFRADRMRQIVSALVSPSFSNFNRKKITLTASTMTSYSVEINPYVKVLLPQEDIKNTLSEILEQNSMSQLRVAETEKYAHVTFFFNAGKEKPCKKEKRILINSPQVATYDIKPEMSAREVTDSAVKAIEAGNYDFIAINYANADMVGHTGNYEATMKAVRTIDQCLEQLTKVILKRDGVIIITADHGNAEDMFDHEAHSSYTSHTTNPVPFVLVGKEFSVDNTNLKNGNLSDIAPTILHLLNIVAPKDMTGKNLISKKDGKKKK